MTTLKDRPNTAVAVIDMQIGVVENAENVKSVIMNIACVVGMARAKGIPVIWVQHSDPSLIKGSADWQFVPGLAPADGEPIVEKSYPDSFEETDFEAVLRALRIGKLVVAGAQTDACVLSTLHGAFVRGYDATLIGDAHTTVDQTEFGGSPPGQVISHANLYWSGQSAPGRTAETTQTSEFGR